MALPDYHAAQFGRTRRARLGVAIFILLWVAGLLGAVSAHSSSLQAKLDQAREYYDKAREVHASLVLTPSEKRDEKDYANLIEDFRRVYLTAPTYGNDTVCLMMVGDLSEEAARRFNQPRYFQDAIDSYEFLLKEYPGSQFRFEALHSIARVYQQDLAQPAKALEEYKRYLKMFPGSAQARQVEVEVARLQDQLGNSSSKTAEITAETTGGRASLQASVQAPAPTPPSNPASAPSSAQAPARTPIQTMQASSQSPGQSPEPPVAASSAKSDNKSGKKIEAAPAVGTDLGLSVTANGSSEATISGVRFWKTADDSRVVLETGQKVKYEVGRATSPDRLYLDLYDTKVTPASGKTVSVDDGLLKNIRLGQYKPGVSRVVLDLSDKTEFVISELTNPYRLVIDVHPAAQGAIAALAGPDAKGVAAKQDASRQVSAATPATTPSTVSAAGATTNSAATAPGAPLAAKQAPASGSTTLSAAPFGTPDARTVATKAPDKSAAPDRSPKKTPVAAKPEPVQIAKATLPSTSSAAASPAASADKSSADKQSADKASIERAAVDKSPADRSSDRSPDKSVDKIKAADPISGSGQTLTRALGLKIGRILIDPGHGGHDTGTIGPSGYTEKELVLDVSQRLGKLIEDRLGSEVDFTREDDNFVPLEERAEMANKMQADLFISIHANSSHARTASGIETYYLSLTADPEALEVAARENAVSQETISELQGLVRKIALNEKVDESKEFATKVQAALSKNLAKGKTQRFDRGVKKAPFVVLIGANMPAILAEISFLSNPEEEKKLKTPEQRQKIAEALYAGVSGYAGTLSGVKNVHRVHEDKPLETSQPAQPAPAHSDKSQPTQTASLD